jgi:mono/diheme cytochrome c family protein
MVGHPCARSGFLASVVGLVLVAIARADLPSSNASDPSDLWVSSAPSIASPLPDLQRGRELYDAKCRICHGRNGAGDGAAADYLSPLPRDLTRGVFAYRSTPTGNLPTDQDLFERITRGVPGTAMPGYSGLSEADRWHLVALVKSFSPRFRDEAPNHVLAPSEPPLCTPTASREGRALYERSGCVNCHGESGRGGGPAAKTLVRDDGEPAHAADLTRVESYHGGAQPGDIYRTLLTGLDGTPMPAYDQSLTGKETWDLVCYLRELLSGETATSGAGGSSRLSSP